MRTINIIAYAMLILALGASNYKISKTSQYAKVAYKDGFEAGSKTVTCDEEKEAAFNDGVMDGLQRAKTMCGIVIRRNTK